MGNVEEQIKQAKALERAQNGAAALESFLRLTGEPGPHTEDPGFWLHLAELARRSAKPEPAVRGYTKAIELLVRSGHPNSALSVARRLARLTPDAVDSHVRHGRIASELGYGVEARDAFLRAADAGPHNGDLQAVVDGLSDTWSVLRQSGRDDDAEAVRARLLELSPGSDPAAGGAAPSAAAAAPEPERGVEPPRLDEPISGLDDFLPSLEPPQPPPQSGHPPPQELGDDLPPLDLDDTTEGGELPALEGIGAALDDLDWPAISPDPGPASEPAPPGASEPQEPQEPGSPLAPSPPGAGDDDLQVEAPYDQHRELLDSDLRLDSGGEEERAAPTDRPISSGLSWTAGLEDTLESDATSSPPESPPGPSGFGDDELDAISPPGDLPPIEGDAPPAQPAGRAESPRELTEGAERGREPHPAPAQPPEPEPGWAPLPEAEPERPRSPEPPPPPAVEGEYIDLASLIMGEEEDVGTRFLTDAAGPPTGDEDRDFAEILNIFRQKVSEKIHPQDSSSHYDLGVAYKEMGLLDDAIGQLQLALRAGANPVATLEVIGECFIEKGEPALAKRVLDRATGIHGASDSDLVGVLYWLGRCEELLASAGEARGHYERVLSVDISFRDAAERLKGLRG